MQNIKKLYKLHKVRSQIDQILQISELSFVKDEYFMRVVRSVQKLQKNQISGLGTMLITFIKKKIYKQKMVMRFLFIIHQVLRSNKNFQLSNVIIQLLLQLLTQLKSIKQQSLQGIDDYLKNVFSLPYSAYLIKAYGRQSQQQFQYQLNRQKCDNKPQDSVRSNVNSKIQTKNNMNKDFPIDQIDFTTFNKVLDVLKFNGQLSQMGRFYPEHQYIINFYLQMLRDLERYFITIRQQFYSLLRLENDQIIEQEKQKLFLFLSESQKCVNRMNSFYYNKYLYYYVNQMINLKMELEIPQFFYKILNKECQKYLKKQNIQICLTAPSHYKRRKEPLQQTKQSSRSKYKDHSKIISSIVSLSQALERIQSSKIQSKSKKILQQKDHQQLQQ